jgi:hypothetical protein
MNRRVFLLHVGGLGGVVMGPRRYGYAGPASEGHAVAEDLLDARLLTPEPRQVALRKASVSLDATWGVSVVEPRDGRAAELASRLISQVARLGGPQLRRVEGLDGGDTRHRVILTTAETAAARVAMPGAVADMLRSQRSILPSRLNGQVRERREAYWLSIGPDRIMVVGAEIEGLLHAGQTLMQLVGIGALSGPGRVPEGTVVDWPAKAMRGYLADVRKPPYRIAGPPLEGWKRHVDILAGAKCNYIVFEQSLGFQYAFAGEPVGLPGGFNVATGRELSEYAHARGIMAIPTIELSRGDSLRPYLERHQGRYPWMMDHGNAGFCPFNDASYQVIDQMLGELAAAFPDSPYVHVGEDETSAIGGSEACPRCREAVGRYAVGSGLQPDPIGYPMSFFHTRVSDLAKKHGLQTMVWGTFAFLRDDKIREVVPRVLSKDVIVWDWLQRGFDKLGYQVWSPYLPSWEWKGPGVRELVTHMIALQSKPAWDDRPINSEDGIRAFAGAWAVSTFGILEPSIVRRCLTMFGKDPYGWALGDEDVPRSRWLRARFGGYLCLRPEEFQDVKRRHPSATSVMAQIREIEEHGKFFHQMVSRVRLNRHLMEWYLHGVELSWFGLQYVVSLQRAYEALREAVGHGSETARGRSVLTARQELEAILARYDGPLSAIRRRSEVEIGGPVLGRDGDYDVSGVTSGVKAAIQVLLKRVSALTPGGPMPTPEALGLFPTVADA